jgi:membrane protein DedA with SNARE-associated domain
MIFPVGNVLNHYGYLAVIVGVGGESVGVPLPGETVLIVAATYAGTSQHLTPALVVLAAACAAIVGDNIGFRIGRTFGDQVLGWTRRHLGSKARHVTATQGLLDRHSSTIIVGGRFVSVVRTYTAFIAGSRKMRWSRFAILNAVGSIAWAATVGFGSAALGSAVGQSFSYAVLGFVILAGIAASLWFRHSRSRMDSSGSTAEGNSAPVFERDSISIT